MPDFPSDTVQQLLTTHLQVLVLEAMQCRTSNLCRSRPEAETYTKAVTRERLPTEQEQARARDLFGSRPEPAISD